MIHRDETASAKQLAIVEKFEAFINYAYPIAQNIPRQHGVARDGFLHAVFSQVELFIVAGKSGQASRLYAASPAERRPGQAQDPEVRRHRKPGSLDPLPRQLAWPRPMGGQSQPCHQT
jgi:hypothetical protein